MRRKGGRGMSEWKKVKLGEVCDTQYGFTASTVQQDTGTQFLRITDIVPQLIDWNTVPYCQIQEKDREKYLLHKGDIVVARTGATVGYAKYIKEDVPAVFASYLVRLLVNSIDVDRHYVGLCVESNLFKEYIQSISNGSAQPNANAQMISSFEINLPPLSTQHRIATILSRYDSLIENYQKQIKLLEEAAQRLYKEWFVDLRFPGHENTNIIDGVPEGWEKKSVDSIYNIKYGKNLSTKLITETGFYPVYGANGVIGYYDKANCNEQVVLITSRGNGSGDVLMTYHKDAFITNNSFIVTPSEGFEYCKLPFTFQFLKMANFRAVRTGAAQPQLTNQSIHTVDVILPNKNLIEKFCSATIEMNDTIIKYREQIRLLTEARDRLLPKLMSGEITI